MQRRVDLNSRAKRLVQPLTSRPLNDFADREIGVAWIFPMEQHSGDEDLVSNFDACRT